MTFKLLKSLGSVCLRLRLASLCHPFSRRADLFLGSPITSKVILPLGLSLFFTLAISSKPLLGSCLSSHQMSLELSYVCGYFGLFFFFSDVFTVFKIINEFICLFYILTTVSPLSSPIPHSLFPFLPCTLPSILPLSPFRMGKDSHGS